MNPRNHSRFSAGFTLIEVMIVVVIVAILATIALPSYRAYIIRGKLMDGQTALGEGRIKMEQYYQDNRNYGVGSCGSVGPLVLPASKYFSITCAFVGGDTQTFLLTASSLANQGMGSAGAYAYTVNNQNAKTTSSFEGASQSGKNCWLYRGDEC